MKPVIRQSGEAGEKEIGSDRKADERLRVLVISELYPSPAEPISGIFVERQVRHLQSLCDVTVISPVRVFPHLRIWRQAGRPRAFVRAVRGWVSALSVIPKETRRHGVPVFYPRYTSPPRQFIHGIWGYFCYIFLKKKVKRLHARKQFDLVHAHYAIPCGVVAILSRRFMRVPVLVSVHGADVNFTVKQNRVSAWIVRWVLNRADLVVVHSSWSARQVASLGVRESKIRTLPLGGDPPEALIERNRSAECLRLLTVGYLYEAKGHRYVLEAMKELRDQGYPLRYTIVGEGPERKRLEGLTKLLMLEDAVTFVGQKAHEEVWAFYRSCDIFVLPSVVEGFGLVFIEALGAGMPIIGCEGTGAPDDLHYLGDCIELVRPRDVKSLVRGLKRLLDDPHRRMRMAELGQNIVRTRYSWALCAEATMGAYLEVAAGTTRELSAGTRRAEEVREVSP
jgi:glycosyltransferase involved in cell wall biosynthesis